MLKNIKKRTEGFTIIEVLIVLAIAGLILLIVFLAVPALQRNQRNTQRKNDVAAVQSAISNFSSNNNGSLPTQLGYVTADTKSATVYCSGAAPALVTTRDTAVYTGANCSNLNLNYEQAKTGIYDLTTANAWIGRSNVAPTVVAATAVTSDTQVNQNSFVINLGYSCNAVASGAPVDNPRAVSIYYVTETGSGNGSLQCVGS